MPDQIRQTGGVTPPADVDAGAAVAGLIEDIIGEQSSPGVVTDMMGNYAPVPSVRGDMYGNYQPVVAAADTPAVEQPAPAVPQIEEPELPSWTADTAGLDWLDDEEDEPAPPILVDEDDQEPDWESDNPDQSRKIQKLERQLQWERDQRVKQGQKNWRQEAARRFPLADVDEIDATSRRSFMRKAYEQHARTERKLKPVLDQVDALRQRVITDAHVEARARAAEQWGPPTQGPPQHAIQQAETNQQLDRSKFRNAHDYIAAKLKRGEYGPI